MKKTVLLIVLLVLVLGAAGVIYGSLSGKFAPDEPVSGAHSAPSVKTTADFTVTDVSGREVKLSDNFGKPVVVNFWATWCPPCRNELPDFNALAAEYGDRVVFLMVNCTDQESGVAAVNKFISDEGYTFPLYYDGNGSASRTYGVTGIPTTLFIAPDGTLADTQVGMLTGSALRSGIENLLAP
ncbi:MAG: TlpA family protein disulfide reductase [Clostridia bacterium]|nr:TlpA family protein disulfide reductase [Clostridia bacterium]